KKPQKAILYVSGDALRVSDDVSQHLIVDQTIEKVSFCAPDRGHEKGFAYICRDGATRRWMCHAFLAVKGKGERLSHAVGCAFAICLEKKQKRERDALQLASSDDRGLTRVGSFRPASLAERLIDPQSTMLTEPLSSAGDVRQNANGIIQSQISFSSPASPANLAGAIPRPRPSPSITDRQGSLRLFPKLHDVSPFKRDLSLRLEELPSNIQRLARVTNGDPIPEETGTEIDESLSKLMSSVSTSSAPEAQTTLPGVATRLQSGSNCGELVRFSPTGTLDGHASPTSSLQATTTTPTTTMVTSAVTTSASFAPSFLTDPFSAAPFNPATIQQHQAGIPSLTDRNPSDATANQLTVRTVTATTNAGNPDEPKSPFLGGPPIVAPRPTQSFVSSPWHNGTLVHYPVPTVSSPTVIPGGPGVAMPMTVYQQPGSPQLSLAYPTYQTQVSQAAFGLQSYPSGYTSPWSTSNTPMFSIPTSTTAAVTWPTPVTPSLLPPEPNRFADPFDVGWADRTTAVFTSPGPSASSGALISGVHKPGNPFLSSLSPTTTTTIAIGPLAPTLTSGQVNGYGNNVTASSMTDDLFS
ncbi:Cell polarity protein, partial [Fasciola gigantica]